MQLLAIGYFTWQYTSIMSLQPEKLHSQSHGHSEACASHTDQSRERPLQMRHTSKIKRKIIKFFFAYVNKKHSFRVEERST